MTATYTFTKLNEQGRICKVTITQKSDGTFTARWFRPGFCHATDKLRAKLSDKSATKIWKELIEDGYKEVL